MVGDLPSRKSSFARSTVDLAGMCTTVQKFRPLLVWNVALCFNLWRLALWFATWTNVESAQQLPAVEGQFGAAMVFVPGGATLTLSPRCLLF